jgi:hypothetical protein
MEHLAGRDEVVPHERRDRDDGAQRGRGAAPEPAAATTDEHEEDGTEGDRQAGGAGQPEQDAGRELASVEAPERRQPCPPPRLGVRRRAVWVVVRRPDRSRIGAQRDPDRAQQEPDGHHVREEPRRAELRGVEEHRPEAEEERGDGARPGADRQPPQHPPRQRDVDRPEQPGDRLGIGAHAPQRHERRQEQRGQRREGDQPLAGR